jgi:hypothetical protein
MIAPVSRSFTRSSKVGTKSLRSSLATVCSQALSIRQARPMPDPRCRPSRRQ